MPTDLFSVVAEPARRRILDQLIAGDASVGDLVDRLDLPQPTVSKHLRVLRDTGFVSCRTAAQKRIYRLDRAPFDDFDAWLAPYRQLWASHFDALGRHLDSKEQKS